MKSKTESDIIIFERSVSETQKPLSSASTERHILDKDILRCYNNDIENMNMQEPERHPSGCNFEECLSFFMCRTDYFCLSCHFP